jgi:hypothetical protein
MPVLDNSDFFHCHEAFGDVFIYEGDQFVEIVFGIDQLDHDWQILI